MWNIDKVIINNIKSHVNSVFCPKKDQNTMIYGVYKSVDENCDSNGSGKSSIIEAITLALIDRPNNKIGIEEYINHDADEATVELHMSNSISKEKLQIRRSFFRKKSKSAKTAVWVNGVLNKEIINSKEATKFILEKLDISKEDLLNYFIINQENSHSFFSSTDTVKKAIISRFSNVVLVDKILHKIEEDLKSKEKELMEVNSSTESVRVKIETLQESLEYEKSGRGAENEDKVVEIEESVDECNEEIGKANEGLKKQQIRLSKALKITEAKEKLYKKTKNVPKPDKQKAQLKLFRREKKEIEGILSDLNNTLAGEIECPNCNHFFSLDPDADLDVAKETLESCELLLKQLKTNMLDISEEIDGLEEQRNSVYDVRSEYNEANLLCGVINGKIEKFKQIISNKESLIELHRKSLQSLKDSSLNTNRIKSLEKEIKVKNIELRKNQKEAKLLSKQKEEIEFWKIKYGNSGFKTFLANKVLSNFEGHINHFLEKFKINLTVKIDGYKILKSGDVREQINILINKSKGWKPFDSFSGGQRERINICGILTLHRLINMTSKSGGLNFLALDEKFEGLDISGQRSVLDLMENCGTTNLIISHFNNDVGAKNKIFVHYEDNVSTLKNG